MRVHPSDSISKATRALEPHSPYNSTINSNPTQIYRHRPIIKPANGADITQFKFIKLRALDILTTVRAVKWGDF